MTENNDQLTRTQLVGMLLLGVCVWAIIIGVIYASVAKNSVPGLIIATTGLIGGGILNWWLIFINKPEE